MKNLKYERVRIALKDGILVVRLEGAEFVAEIVRLECGDEVDLTLPIGGEVPVKSQGPFAPEVINMTALTADT